MITTGPAKPSSRRVAAALPPATPPPTITIGLPPVLSDTQYILPSQFSRETVPRRLRSRAGAGAARCNADRLQCALLPGRDASWSELPVPAPYHVVGRTLVFISGSRHYGKVPAPIDADGGIHCSAFSYA